MPYNPLWEMIVALVCGCPLTSQQYVGEDGRLHIEDPAKARRIAKDLYAAETGNVFPFQQDNGVRVSINISTHYEEQSGPKAVNDVLEQPAAPQEPDAAPPRVVLIGAK